MSRYDTRVTNRQRTPEEERWLYDPSMADPYGPGYDPGLVRNPFAELEQPPPADTPWGSVDANGEEWGRGVRNEYKLPSPEDDVQTARALSRTDSTWASDAVPLAERPPAQETGELEEESLAEETASSEETLPVEQKRDYTDVSRRVSTTPGKGARPDPFGRDDETMTRDERMRLAGEAYDKVETGGGGVGRWEDEFTRERGSNRMTDDQIRRRGAVIGFLGGAFEGDSSSGTRWAEQQYRANQGYEEGRAKARDRDQSGRRISKALAQSIVAARLATPEEAATLTHGDELVKTFTSGAYSQGSRAEALEQKYQTHMTDTDRKIAELEARERMAGESRASQERIAETYAKRPKSGGAEKVSPQGMTNVIARTLWDKFKGKLTADQVRAAAAGDFSSIPEGLRDDVRFDVESLRELDDRASVRPLAPNVSSEQAKVPTRTKAAVDKETATARFKPSNVKEDQEITLLANQVRRADQAWALMKKSEAGLAAQRAYVEYGRGMPEGVRSQGLGAYQAEAGELEAVVGRIRRTTLGLAQTIPELANLAIQMGMTAETWDPFKGPEAFERALQRIMSELRLRKKLQRELSEPQEP